MKEEESNFKSNINNNNGMQEKEFEKLSAYYSKISEYRNNNYINCIFINALCDCLINGEWVVGYIRKIDESGIEVINLTHYYELNDNKRYRIEYSNKIAYFRKHTKPSPKNLISTRENVNLLNERIKSILSADKKNIFNNEKNNNPKKIFGYYYYLHSTIYNAIDYSICKSKEENMGIKEGFTIIILVLEILSDFYNYINNNYQDFLYYKNNIFQSELEDLVLFNQKYAIFSFWEDANLLMNKIFLQNINYSVWFLESEKYLQRIIPSSQNVIINPNDKFFCPLYESQISEFKIKKYNFSSIKGRNLLLKKICIDEAYKNKKIQINEIKYPTYILSYFIDYFYALGGYNSLFKLCRGYSNIIIMSQIFDNILYGCALTNKFRGKYESEKNYINMIIFQFMNSLTPETFKTFQKKDIITFLTKGCNLYPNINDNSTFFFEELYIRLLLKNLIFENNVDKKLECLDEINNILLSLEYNIIINENKNNIKGKLDKNTIEELDKKYLNRDKLILEMNYHSFCSNCKNNQLIENLFKNNDINDKILVKFIPILYALYKDNFGYIISSSTEEKIRNTKSIVFNTLLNKIKQIGNQDLNFIPQLLNIISDFCKILIDEDKYYIFSEIKKIFFDFKSKNNINCFKEIFYFIIKFTSIAIKNSNLSNNSLQDENITKTSKKNNIELEEIQIDINSIFIDEKKYYGIELIIDHLSFEQYDQLQMNPNQKIEIINSAINGIIDIIPNIKPFKNILNIIFNKIYNSIKNKKDTTQYILLLNKFLNYSIFDNFISEFIIFFNEYIRNVELIEILVDELNNFIDKLGKDQIINEENNISVILDKIDKNIEIQNENKFLSEKLNIALRIKTIFDVILYFKSNKFDYNELQKLFIKLIKLKEYTRDTLYHYLLKYINLLQFDFIEFIYNNIISKNDIFIINNLTTFQICKNIIIQLSKKNNNINLMNNKDIGFILDKKLEEIEVKGLNLLWDLLLSNNKSIDNNTINGLTDFLSDFYFGIRIKSPTNQYKAYEEYWTNLINNISGKLENLIKEKNNNTQPINSLIIFIQKLINKIKNENKEIITDLKQIEREGKKYNNKKIAKEFTFTGIKLGNLDYYTLDIKINEGDPFYILRYKLSYYYKIPVNQIGIEVYLNKIGKIKNITENDIKKLHMERYLKQFNFLNDFEDIYAQLNGLYEFNNLDITIFPLLIEVKSIEDIGKNIIKANPIDIIYEKSKIPIIFIDLLNDEAPYAFNVFCLLKKNFNNNNILKEEIKNIILNNQDNNNLFDFENKNIYYLSYIIMNLNDIIINNNNERFIYKLFKSIIWKNNNKNINILNKELFDLNNEHTFLIGELYEKFNLVNNLVNIFIYGINNIKENDSDKIWPIIYKIIQFYIYIINKSINLNLNKYEESKDVSIVDVKNIFNQSLNNLNNLILNNEKFLKYIIQLLINDSQNNEEIKKIKDSFEYIIFESILKNKHKSINKRIKSFIINLINKIKDDSQNSSEKFYSYLQELYLSEKTFDKITNIFEEINEKNINIDDFIFENNSKILFEVISEVLSNIFEFIKDKFEINEYINNVLFPKLYNIYTPNTPNDNIIHQLILGGACKIFFSLLLLPNNSYDLLYDKNKQFLEYLFDNIIMSKCNENILNIMNINYENNQLAITSSFCIKEASNLFILLLFKNNKLKNNEDVYNNYIKKLTLLHNLCYWKGNNVSDWKLYFKENKKLTPFVGLKNLGCTCYINCLIQIFYNISLFREMILKYDISFHSEKNCLYQLIKIFYSLKYLQADYYSPRDFVNNFDDESLNVNIQMDVLEFFCELLDKIEQKIKNSKNENIIKYFFMGRQNDILKFEDGCNHQRINESQFYSIQLQVKGRKDIYDSLNSLIEGERMDGDNSVQCPKCNKKYAAVKTQNFKTLPRFLIFVLKRFEFNYQTKKKIKINDYYEFPLNLDMNKYTEKFINNNENTEDNTYKLKSIIIHQGTCEAGHYYSFILDEKSNEWYEFNDTKVKKFNIETLDIEGFSKKEITIQNGQKIEKENNRNAYMLFYEKINKDNCENFDKIEIINNIKEKVNDDNDENEFDSLENKIHELSDVNYKKKIQNKINILNSIKKETFKYYLNKRLFSEEYHHFILSLFINTLNKYNFSKNTVFSEDLCSNKNSYNLNKEIIDFKKDRKTLELSNIENYLLKNKIYFFNSENNINSQINEKGNKIKILELFKHFIIYFFNVMLRAREKGYLGGFVNLIKYFINNYLFCADYLIEEFANINTLIEYLINCPSYEIKKLIVGIIYCAMMKSVTSYENEMKNKKENINKNVTKTTINKQNENIKENIKIKDNNKKIIKVKKNQEMNDEQLARILQAEENRKFYGLNTGNSFLPISSNYQPNSKKNLNQNSKKKSNQNLLESSNIPNSVLKLIYNALYLISTVHFGSLNESRFLYFLLYRFSLISKQTKLFLINKVYLIDFLYLILMPRNKDDKIDESLIINSLNKGMFASTHNILNPQNNQIKEITDKVGVYHYENYITILYFYLLSDIQNTNSKQKIFKGDDNFDNKNFIKALFFKINTKQDAYEFSNLICVTCNNTKKRIDYILLNIFNILENADNIIEEVTYNERINNKKNKDYDLEKDFPKINPRYILLILKRFIIRKSDNSKMDEYRINSSLSSIFKLLQKNAKFYSYYIMLADFLIELFINNINTMINYINSYCKNFGEIIQWIENHPISPELYPIEGILMYKNYKMKYSKIIPEEQKIIFNEEQIKRSERRILNLNRIIFCKIKGYDYNFEVDFDLTDFKFRSGDYIYYKQKKAIIKECLDELILIKILDRNKKEPNNVNENEDNNSIRDLEKVKFWVAKDDENISIYSLE